VRVSYYAEVRVLTELTRELAESPFSRVGALEPGGAEGPGADPEAAVRPPGEAAESFFDDELTVIGRFAAYLAEARGLAASTVEKHVTNAQIFVEFLVAYQGAPVRAVHEYDLRFFPSPRHAGVARAALRVPGGRGGDRLPLGRRRVG
jgi:hypothetical protein